MRYTRERDARRIVRQPFEFQNELIVLYGFTDTIDSGDISIKLLDCWPHLDRNARKKKGLLAEYNRYNDIIKPQLDYLSQSRSKQQFEALSALITQNWDDFGEGEYAAWLDTEYLTEPCHLWFYTASDVPGIIPNQNPIESHHHSIKTTAVNQLRASTGHVLASTLPKILVECVMEIGSESIQHFAAGPVSAEVLAAGVLLCNDDSHFSTHQRKSRRAICNIRTHYFNQRYSIVTVLDRLPYERDWNSPLWSLEEINTIRKKVKCDCKDFYQTGWLCAHVLGCLHLVDNLDLAVMRRGLPARSPPGRPRKKSKCLQRDGVRTSQYSVDALVKRLVDKPASVINWSVLIEKTVAEADGEGSQRAYVGKIKPPFTRGGKRFWEIAYEDQDEVTVLEVEALARTINFSFQMGHNIVPN
ncbi:hypothetical protein PHYSODRAFT_338915 [Phytophthora sojae]|uniref:SWIM-type domain-containing protein n=1 Tax=Phytophthora sojae (strain P6497) TaxID=1094619 RepID=G5A3Y6_PHYSP|nr:hypothetical protein PHYSODRAFT_338915 [Phytophthora sojae]EGZ10246.1 hypothetical protein PHYSODRAFT_338915 [Phytophthora sojae]|eukprot:XP_009535107.1 hypothetical protein PHYSODRAFT_338915 [Phytophthora sojae]